MAKEKKVTVGPKVVKELKALAAALETAHTEAQLAEASINPCATWAIVKPYWPLIVRLATLIPRVGKQVSAALETVGTVLETLCPAP